MNNHSSMILSRDHLSAIDGRKIELPEERLFSIPEKVLQFGTGVFIRSFCDYFIDHANKQGAFNGRIVVVKSTSNGSSDSFDNQDNLYTIGSKGIENGIETETYSINASISRVINSNSHWNDILACASNPEMKIILSNTTEVGIQYVAEDIHQKPPKSFPGKLLSFLHARYKAFNGSDQSGMVIIPAELIPDNAMKLKKIVTDLADYNKLDTSFIHWLENANYFCNSLVDRIVPGKPSAERMEHIQSELGYKDDLFCESEIFSLWAIEGDDKIKETLSFAPSNPGVVIQSDINLFRELKLRLLNGTHTFNCGPAFLCGIELTRDAVKDPVYSEFMKKMMEDEIATAIPYEIDTNLKLQYSDQVLERFANPYINHKWLSITAQYSSKMKNRNVPLLLHYFKKTGAAPEFMSLGFAGYLLFMKSTFHSDGKYYGEVNGMKYEITDDAAGILNRYWTKQDASTIVRSVLADIDLWGEDLNTIEGFEIKVSGYLKSLMDHGMMQTIIHLKSKNLEVKI